jgi:hypothetical protein
MPARLRKRPETQGASQRRFLFFTKERNMGASPAELIQQAREAADLTNHQERLEWLSAERPTWACGTPVDSHMKHALLAQSLDFVRQAR